MTDFRYGAVIKVQREHTLEKIFSMLDKMKKTGMIAPKTDAPFHMTAIETTKSFTCTNGDTFSLLIVLSGQGAVRWEGGEYILDAASRLFLPHGLKEFTLVNKNGIENPLKVVRCYPPVTI